MVYFLNLSPLLSFVAPPDGIKILGIPFGFAFFSSFFLQEALGEDVWHADVILRLSDV
jgi:hypothetical protein